MGAPVWKERRDIFGYTLDVLRQLIREGDDSGPALDGPAVMTRLLAKCERQQDATKPS